MALIICTECGYQFSDKASACPSCGCPVEFVLEELKEEEEKRKKELKIKEEEDNQRKNKLQKKKEEYSVETTIYLGKHEFKFNQNKKICAEVGAYIDRIKNELNSSLLNDYDNYKIPLIKCDFADYYNWIIMSIVAPFTNASQYIFNKYFVNINNDMIEQDFWNMCNCICQKHKIQSVFEDIKREYELLILNEESNHLDAIADISNRSNPIKGMYATNLLSAIKGYIVSGIINETTQKLYQRNAAKKMEKASRQHDCSINEIDIVCNSALFANIVSIISPLAKVTRDYVLNQLMLAGEIFEIDIFPKEKFDIREYITIMEDKNNADEDGMRLKATTALNYIKMNPAESLLYIVGVKQTFFKKKELKYIIEMSKYFNLQEEIIAHLEKHNCAQEVSYFKSDFDIEQYYSDLKNKEDLDARTYNGVVYDTKEEVELYKKDEQLFFEVRRAFLSCTPEHNPDRFVMNYKKLLEVNKAIKTESFQNEVQVLLNRYEASYVKYMSPVTRMAIKYERLLEQYDGKSESQGQRCDQVIYLSPDEDKSQIIRKKFLHIVTYGPLQGKSFIDLMRKYELYSIIQDNIDQVLFVLVYQMRSIGGGAAKSIIVCKDRILCTDYDNAYCFDFSDLEKVVCESSLFSNSIRKFEFVFKNKERVGTNNYNINYDPRSSLLLIYLAECIMHYLPEDIKEGSKFLHTNDFLSTDFWKSKDSIQKKESLKSSVINFLEQNKDKITQLYTKNNRWLFLDYSYSLRIRYRYIENEVVGYDFCDDNAKMISQIFNTSYSECGDYILGLWKVNGFNIMLTDRVIYLGNTCLPIFDSEKRITAISAFKSKDVSLNYAFVFEYSTSEQVIIFSPKIPLINNIIADIAEVLDLSYNDYDQMVLCEECRTLNSTGKTLFGRNKCTNCGNTNQSKLYLQDRMCHGKSVDLKKHQSRIKNGYYIEDDAWLKWTEKLKDEMKRNGSNN